MKHKPCRLLGNAHIAGDLVRANTVLAVCEHPRSGEPLVQRDRAILKNRTDLNGELAFRVMAPALPSAPIRVEADLLRSATGTGHAVRPTADSEVIDAVVGIREVDDRFLKALRLVFHD